MAKNTEMSDTQGELPPKCCLTATFWRDSHESRYTMQIRASGDRHTAEHSLTATSVEGLPTTLWPGTAVIPPQTPGDLVHGDQESLAS